MHTNQAARQFAVTLIAGGLAPLALAQSSAWTVTELHPGPEYAHSSASEIRDGVIVGWVARDEIDPTPEACMWTAFSADSFVSLHPGGEGTVAVGLGPGGTSGVQVGARKPFPRVPLAALWRGDSSTFVDLHPAGADISWAFDTDGTTHVGHVDDVAGYWTGDSTEFTVLAPEGAILSYARGIDNGRQVGSVYSLDFGGTVAAMWSGTRESFVSLHPDGAINSTMTAIHGDELGGAVYLERSQDRAALWHGTAESWVDLHDDAWVRSRVHDVFDGWQVGVANPPSPPRGAGIWHGTPESFEDLHSLLPPLAGTYSIANGVWHDGRTLYVVGTTRTGDEIERAYLWSRPLCLADLDGDGALTIFDFLTFQNLFDAGDPAADFDGDGDLTLFDFLAFQNAFDAGCD